VAFPARSRYNRRPMPPALRQLMLLQLRGLFRRGLRQARTARGAVFFAFGLVAALGWLASVVMASRMDRADPRYVRDVLPLALLGITLLTALTSAGEKAIAFTGGEVDFLFPGPFTRRQLLLYKTCKGAFVSALSGLVFSAAVFRYTSHWWACYVGSVLALLFIQFAGTVGLLAVQGVGARARNRGRLALLLAVLGLVAYALYSAGGPNVGSELLNDPWAVMRQFAGTPTGTVLLAPFQVLTRVMTATDLGAELWSWAAAAAGMNVVLVGVILMLDAGFVEAASGASERRYERLRRMRAGGAVAVGVHAKHAARALPMLPRLGGAGPIAWRQLTHAHRASRSLIVVLLVLAASVGPVLIVSAKQRDPSAVAVPVLAAVAWMSVLLASVLRFDFRADLDAMDTLKSLPLSPLAVTAGQLVAPTLVMTLIHWVVVAATLVATDGRPVGPAVRTPMLVAAALAPPFNLLMFAAENLVFLLAPTRPAGAGPGDFSVLGRQLFTLGIRTAGVAVAAALAAGLAILAYHLTPAPFALPVATGVAFVLLAAEGVAAVPLVAWAFRRFDPSVHMPG
jgi:hypothetical protein